MKSLNQFRFGPRWLLFSSLLVFFGLFPWRMAQGAEKIPTVEELTGGKLKVGDLVTKENVDLVKEFLPPSDVEKVKRGMVIILAPTTPVEETFPKYFLEATEKHQGMAVLGNNKVIYTKDGKKWPGGVPFPDPKTADEVIANYRFTGMGYGVDDFRHWVVLELVDKKGVNYKSFRSLYCRIWGSFRMDVPPLGQYTGHEEEEYRHYIWYLAPEDAKGLGILNIRYYDNQARPDEGYIYVPALRRARRISATNWQDNQAGTDMTWGDPEGFFEPLNFYDYKLLGKRMMVFPGYTNPVPEKRPDGTYDLVIKFDVGRKFRRWKYEVRPVYVVEATPKMSHIYAKQILYIDGLTFRDPVVEKFDRQMKLWKSWGSGYSNFKQKDGFWYVANFFSGYYDFQADHTTHINVEGFQANYGARMEEYTLKKLLEMSK